MFGMRMPDDSNVLIELDAAGKRPTRPRWRWYGAAEVDIVLPVVCVLF